MDASLTDQPEPVAQIEAPPEPASPSETRVAVLPQLGEQITAEDTHNTYTIGDRIGEGAFGVVFACKDVWENDLAVKVLKPTGAYDKVRAAAISEFEKLVQLRHPHITFVHDAFEYRDTFYLITERCYCPLSNLFTLEKFDGMSWLLPVARCLLQAVHYLHLHGYAHQDIHQGNVFAAFARNEMVPDQPGGINFKVGDFGVAKLFAEIDAMNTRNQGMLPPEVLQPSEFGPVDYRIDLYHVGLLLLQLASSKELEFTREQILEGAPRKMALELPSPFNFALEKTLRRHVQFRTATAMELWRDLHGPPALPVPDNALTEGQDHTAP